MNLTSINGTLASNRASLTTKTSQIPIFCRVEYLLRKSDSGILDEREGYIVVQSNISLSLLLPISLKLLECCESDAVNAEGFVQIENWDHPIPFSMVTNEPDKRTVHELLSHITNHVKFLIRIRVDHVPTTTSVDACHLVLQLSSSIGNADTVTKVLTQFRCPLSREKILSIVQSGNSQAVQLTFSELRAFEKWYSSIQERPDPCIAADRLQNFIMQQNVSGSRHLGNLSDLYVASQLAPAAFPCLLTVSNNNNDNNSVGRTHYKEVDSGASQSQAEPNDKNKVSATAPHPGAESGDSAISTAATTTTSTGGGISQRSEPTSNKQHRLRTSFDSDLELPLLLRWFQENPHPTRVHMQEYVQMLNQLPSRQNKRKLDLTNILYWFKNARATAKKKQRGQEDNSMYTGNDSLEDNKTTSDIDDSISQHEENGNLQTTRKSRYVYHDEADASQAKRQCLSPNSILKTEEFNETNEEWSKTDQQQPESNSQQQGALCMLADAVIATQSQNSTSQIQQQPALSLKSEESPESCSAVSRDTTSITPASAKSGASSTTYLPVDFASLIQSGLSLPDPSVSLSYSLASAPQQLLSSSLLAAAAASGLAGAPNPLGSSLPGNNTLFLEHLTKLFRASVSSNVTTTTDASNSAVSKPDVNTSCSNKQYFTGTSNTDSQSGDDLDDDLAEYDDSNITESYSADTNGKTASNLNNNQQRRKGMRTRVFIDPHTEIPLLEKWFQSDSHPSQSTLEHYCEHLNNGLFRQRQPRLEPKNIQLWFKNHRAKVKREQQVSSADGSGGASPTSQSVLNSTSRGTVSEMKTGIPNLKSEFNLPMTQTS